MSGWNDLLFSCLFGAFTLPETCSGPEHAQECLWRWFHCSAELHCSGWREAVEGRVDATICGIRSGAGVRTTYVKTIRHGPTEDRSFGLNGKKKSSEKVFANGAKRRETSDLLRDLGPLCARRATRFGYAVRAKEPQAKCNRWRIPPPSS